MPSRAKPGRPGAVFRETRFRVPSPPETALGLWVDRIGAGAGTQPPPGRLRVLGQYAAVAVESGTGVFASPAAGRLRLRAGDAVLLFPDEPTRYGGDPDWFTRWIVWNGPEAAILAAHAGWQPAEPVVRLGADAVGDTFHVLDRLMEAEDFGAVVERKAGVLALAARLMRLRAGAHRDAQRDPVADAIRRADVAGAAPQRVAAWAADCHLSPSQFRRLFRRRTGRSPIEFLIARRIGRAKALLAQGAPIKDAAAQSGFQDVFYFMRLFRKVTGQTAGQFAASAR